MHAQKRTKVARIVFPPLCGQRVNNSGEIEISDEKRTKTRRAAVSFASHSEDYIYSPIWEHSLSRQSLKNSALLATLSNFSTCTSEYSAFNVSEANTLVERRGSSATQIPALIDFQNALIAPHRKESAGESNPRKKKTKKGRTKARVP